MNRLLLVKQKLLFQRPGRGGGVRYSLEFFVEVSAAPFSEFLQYFRTNMPLFQAWLLKYVFGLRAHYPICPTLSKSNSVLNVFFSYF